MGQCDSCLLLLLCVCMCAYACVCLYVCMCMSESGRERERGKKGEGMCMCMIWGGRTGQEEILSSYLRYIPLNNYPYHQELESFEALLSCTVVFCAIFGLSFSSLLLSVSQEFLTISDGTISCHPTVLKIYLLILPVWKNLEKKGKQWHLFKKWFRTGKGLRISINLKERYSGVTKGIDRIKYKPLVMTSFSKFIIYHCPP